MVALPVSAFEWVTPTKPADAVASEPVMATDVNVPAVTVPVLTVACEPVKATECAVPKLPALAVAWEPVRATLTFASLTLMVGVASVEEKAIPLSITLKVSVSPLVSTPVTS